MMYLSSTVGVLFFLSREACAAAAAAAAAAASSFFLESFLPKRGILAADVDTGYRIKKVVAVVVTLVSDAAVAVAVALSVLLGSVQHMEQPAKDFSFSHHKRHSQRG
jgi:hypothetical protein